MTESPNSMQALTHGELINGNLPAVELLAISWDASHSPCLSVYIHITLPTRTRPALFANECAGVDGDLGTCYPVFL